MTTTAQTQAADRSVAALQTRIRSLPTVGLSDMTRAVFFDERAGSESLLPLMMDELERRLTEAEFVAFCRSLEAKADLAIAA